MYFKLEVKKFWDKGIFTEFLCEDEALLKRLENKIDQKVGPLNNKTNVRGKMTDWKCFIKDEDFKNFVQIFIRHMHNASFDIVNNVPPLEIIIKDAWGSILNKGDEVWQHIHNDQYASVLYFDDYAPLQTSAGQFDTKRGLLITIPGKCPHWVDEIKEDFSRKTLVFNWQFKDFVLNKNYADI